MGILDDLTASLKDVALQKLSQQELNEVIQALEVLERDKKHTVFNSMFPEEGEFRRELYPKHTEFFKAGAKYTERAFIAANRSGKTIAACYEITVHVTGEYPPWWEGRRYTRPTKILVSGDTSQTTRDILQFKLLGRAGELGTGMIPLANIDKTRPKRNIPDAIETVYIKHISGGFSEIQFKSYDQGRTIFQGNEYDGVFFDEEAPQDVYSEALIRTMTTQGFAVLTFTPLSGVTELVQSFIENDQTSDTKHPKWVTTCTWWDVPHLSPEDIEKMLAGCPPNLRDARSKGVPTAGSGRIYPVNTDHVTIDDFAIPKYWQKAYGMDVGWVATAAVWGAWDRDSDIIYIYSEHKQGESEPVVHAKAIKARGEWIKGAIDPAARGREKNDGSTLLDMYKKEGLNLELANNAVEAGIYEMWQRLSTGRLKIFKSCTALIRELQYYHRDEKGKIVKKNDHLLDSCRYLVNSDKGIWQYPPSVRPKSKVIPIQAAAWT